MTGYLHPALAALLMVLSSVFVIANSLRLNRFKEYTPLQSCGVKRPSEANLTVDLQEAQQNAITREPRLQEECVS